MCFYFFNKFMCAIALDTEKFKASSNDTPEMHVNYFIVVKVNASFMHLISNAMVVLFKFW